MPVDIAELHELILGLSVSLAEEGTDGCGIIRCRVKTGDLFCHVQRYKGMKGRNECTQPLYTRNWFGHGLTNITPGNEKVYGWSLPEYVLQAFKGMRRDTQGESASVMSTERLRPAIAWACTALDEESLDRLYLISFENEEVLGSGYAYCVRKLVGEPCQHIRLFMGEVTYMVGFVSLGKDEPRLCQSNWQPDHLKALDEAIRVAGLCPNTGIGSSLLRVRVQRMVEGISSFRHC